MKRIACSILLLATLCGCRVTSRAIRGSYIDYNQTIAFNQNQQMLLNLVRLKYRESPLFLKVGALSTSYDFTARAGAGTGRNANNAFFDVNIGPSFSSRPTITYTPLEGNTFVKQVLAEVHPDTFVLLLRSGWPVQTLFHLLAERIGPYRNNEDEPSYEDFVGFIDLLDAAQSADELRFITREGQVWLQLPAEREEFHLPAEVDPDHGHEVALAAFQFRSLLDIMFFLGKNTETPEAHAARVKHGAPNGWIRIRSSSSKPDDALVWVRHGGHYFSIAHDDIRSKDTFALLKLLFQIQAGDITTVQPILTLPVAQP